MSGPVRVGAVIYDPKAEASWKIIAEHFKEKGVQIDVSYYRDHDLLVEALVMGKVEVAWESSLAWLETQMRSIACRAVAMRDTDVDRVSNFVVRTGRGFKNVRDLKGKLLTVGASDSPQATLIPLAHVQKQGLIPERDFKVKRCDLLVGRHGDDAGGELEAFKSLASGEASACAMADLNWKRWTMDGTINPGEYNVLASTEKYDNHVFAVRRDFPADVETRWLAALLSMSYYNPKHKVMMDSEGLRKWVPGRTSGFGQLVEAVKIFRHFDWGKN